MNESEGKPQGQNERFTPSPPKGGKSRNLRRMMQRLSGIRLQQFLDWGSNLPSKHQASKKDKKSEAYKKKRKKRLKMAKESRRRNR